VSLVIGHREDPWRQAGEGDEGDEGRIYLGSHMLRLLYGNNSFNGGANKMVKTGENEKGEGEEEAREGCGLSALRDDGSSSTLPHRSLLRRQPPAPRQADDKWERGRLCVHPQEQKRIAQNGVCVCVCVCVRANV
jgi:hypothetical protein